MPIRALTPAQRFDEIRARQANWAAFIQFAQRHSTPRWVFRGQSQKWPLKPTGGRVERYEFARELQLFNEFKRLASPHVDKSRIESDWDMLSLAQHHGLPTRMLDWTTNPLIAAYFACQPSAKGKRDGEVIAVQIADVGLLSQQERAAGPFGIAATKFMFPTVVAPRIGSQRGLFSVHPNPSRTWILREKTSRHTIKAGDKSAFLDNLFGLGVDAAMVMTDLDGLSRNLMWRYNSGRPI